MTKALGNMRLRTLEHRGRGGDFPGGGAFYRLSIEEGKKKTEVLGRGYILLVALNFHVLGKKQCAIQVLESS